MFPSRAVLFVFLLSQACDGLFTYTAVRAYGIAAEGNMVLATWMALVGPFPTLLVAKMVAAGGGGLLCTPGGHSTRAPPPLFFLPGAVGPWVGGFSGPGVGAPV